MQTRQCDPHLKPKVNMDASENLACYHHQHRLLDNMQRMLNPVDPVDPMEYELRRDLMEIDWVSENRAVKGKTQ